MAQAAFRIFESTRDMLYEEIVESLETLPEVLRVIFVCSHYKGWSPQRLARDLEIPPANVERMLEDANRIFYRNLHQFHSAQ